MLSIEKCKTILKSENVDYTENEVKQISEFLSMLASVEISIKNKDHGKH